MTGRIVIGDVRPRTPVGYPAKAVVGERVRVTADVFKDGHDILAVHVLWRPAGAKVWTRVPTAPLGNDLWEAIVVPEQVGAHEIAIEAYTDRFRTWRQALLVKADAGQEVAAELEEGARLFEAVERKVPRASRDILRMASATLRADLPLNERLVPASDTALEAALADVIGDDATRSAVHPLWVDRPQALFSAWYEFFPRAEGGLLGAAKRLSAVAEMGFDVVYLPPVHPIGSSYRKGANNTLTAGPDDPGSPWAIGSSEGGHTAVHPELGTIDDFDEVVAEAARQGLEVALDYALQCSPDHPWVKEHPEWFRHRPDGSIAYAENPPKKYQDIYPINFWPDREHDRVALWNACKEILDFWIDHGVRIFRVDNPHTKPIAFWEWMIPAVLAEHPDVVLLAEAFTRPKVMAKLAEVGFSQSYTYFTWRNTKDELTEYVEEIALGPKADYMRPSFWPNTPDILAGCLRDGPPSAFKIRLLLAATLVPSYGVYSGYELYENEPFSDANEEYLRSEKYEIKDRDWNDPDSLAPWMAMINDIRRRHPAFAELRNIHFHHADNERVMVWSKQSGDDTVIVVVNLDPRSVQDSWLWLDLDAIGVPAEGPFELLDELTGATYVWDGPRSWVRLDPHSEVAHVLALRTPGR